MTSTLLLHLLCHYPLITYPNQVYIQLNTSSIVGFHGSESLKSIKSNKPSSGSFENLKKIGFKKKKIVCLLFKREELSIWWMSIKFCYLVYKMFKNISLDLVHSCRTCPANLGVRSCPSCPVFICQVWLKTNQKHLDKCEEVVLFKPNQQSYNILTMHHGTFKLRVW